MNNAALSNAVVIRGAKATFDASPECASQAAFLIGRLTALPELDSFEVLPSDFIEQQEPSFAMPAVFKSLNPTQRELATNVYHYALAGLDSHERVPHMMWFDVDGGMFDGDGKMFGDFAGMIAVAAAVEMNIGFVTQMPSLNLDSIMRANPFIAAVMGWSKPFVRSAKTIFVENKSRCRVNGIVRAISLKNDLPAFYVMREESAVRLGAIPPTVKSGELLFSRQPMIHASLHDYMTEVLKLPDYAPLVKAMRTSADNTYTLVRSLWGHREAQRFNSFLDQIDATIAQPMRTCQDSRPLRATYTPPHPMAAVAPSDRDA